MTSELLVMNREAVALAADSAVTYKNGKVFNTANKLFSLSKKHPVGIMIYNISDFMGLPWETIIKMYRSYLEDTSFNTLRQYANDFLNFLRTLWQYLPEEYSDACIKSDILDYLVYIKKNYESNNTRNLIDFLNDEVGNWDSGILLDGVPQDFKDNFIRKHGQMISDLVNELFEGITIQREELDVFYELCVSLFSKSPNHIERNRHSGIVITGFGDEEVFPSYIAYEIDGLFEKILRYQLDCEDKIWHGNNAAMNAFAQTNMVTTFMWGIHPDLKSKMSEHMEGMVDEYNNIILKILVDNNLLYENSEEQLMNIKHHIIEKYNNSLREITRNEHVNPILDTISGLPKGELAAMAEMMVSITSFKTKMTEAVETVGGPVDVAVISKSDGFVWIKRKHYFDPTLNQQFISKYYK